MDLEQKEFHQKIGLNKRKYKILPQGVYMNTVDKGKIEEYTIRFEDLGSTLHFVSNKTVGMYFLVIICILLHTVGLILSLIDGEVAIMRPLFIFSVTGCLIGLYFMPRLLNNGKVYIIDGKKHLMLYSNIPSRVDVENFIADILKAKKEFYLKRYFYSSLGENDQFSQLNTLRWLLHNHIISVDDFENLKREHKIIDLNQSQITGFCIGNDD